MGVVVVPYSDRWPTAFEQESARLRTVLGPVLVGGIEHVGSTAVPGLAAKPILDMLAPVADLDVARRTTPVLADLGYRHADHRPHEAVWFYEQEGQDDATRTHQLHLTRPDSALWRERVAFRDALRADPRLRDEYQSLKQALAADTADLGDYTRGKREFVARVLRSRGLDLR